MNPGYLMLYPAAARPLPAIPELISRLSESGLIGRALPDRLARYQAGPNFLQRITFLGCSPNLPLDVEDGRGDASCTVELLGPYPEVRLMTGQNSRPPRCQGCRQPIAEWRGQLERPDQDVCCPECGRVESWLGLNWRQMAGAARLFIAISQVFPGEAVPTPELMRTLQQEGEAWDYCYVQRPLLWPGGHCPNLG